MYLATLIASLLGMASQARSKIEASGAIRRCSPTRKPNGWRFRNLHPPYHGLWTQNVHIGRLRLFPGGFLEQGSHVHLKAERKCIEHAVHTAAVSSTQIKRARQVVVDSEIDPIISCQADAPLR